MTCGHTQELFTHQTNISLKKLNFESPALRPAVFSGKF